MANQTLASTLQFSLSRQVSMDITRWVIGHVSTESTEPPRSLMSGSTKIHTHCLLSNQRCRDRESLFWLTEARPRVFLRISLGSAFPRRRHMRAGRSGEFSSANNPKAIRLLAAHCIQPVRAPVSPPLCAQRHTRNFANN